LLTERLLRLTYSTSARPQKPIRSDLPHSAPTIAPLSLPFVPELLTLPHRFERIIDEVFLFVKGKLQKIFIEFITALC